MIRLIRNTVLCCVLLLLSILSVSANGSHVIKGTIATVRQDGLAALATHETTIKVYAATDSNTVLKTVQTETPETKTSKVAFSLDGLSVGEYNLVFEKKGYLPFLVKNVVIDSTTAEITLPELTLVPGDFDSNFTVDMTDLVLALRSFDVQSSFDALRLLCDVNEDGVVTVTDLGFLKSTNAYGKKYPENASLAFSPTFVTKRNRLSANYLIEDSSFKTIQAGSSGLQSGWDFDNRGGPAMYSTGGQYSINDTSTVLPCRLIRDITPVKGGTLTLETEFSIVGGANGFYLSLQNSKEEDVYHLYVENGTFQVLTPNGSVPLGISAAKGKYFVKAIINFENGTSRTILNFHDYGTQDILGTTMDAVRYTIGSTDEALVYVVPSYTKLYANYLVNEQFNSAAATTPFGWTLSGTNATLTVNSSEEAMLNVGANGTGSGNIPFEKTGGNLCFTMLFNLNSTTNGLEIALRNQTATAVRFSAQNNQFYAGTTRLKSGILNDFWYLLRIEANTDTQKAVIKLNGKILDTIEFETAQGLLDNLQISLSGSNAVNVKWDDVQVFPLIDYADYVPEPIVPASDNYDIGINVCSLWRNGSHYGWDNISAYDEVKSYLGYYDEGSPEVADWEIKFMVEHGIDFQMYCWYPEFSGAPMKRTHLSDGLNYGFMNAKYSDKMKFAMLWVASGTCPANSEAFRTYYVPYWQEYFFHDSRYMTIDNKLVIAVFGANNLITAFGSEAAVKTEFDYVRSVAVSMGFDGVIFITSNAPSTSMKNCGFDASYAYNWGKSGYDLAFTQSQITSQINQNAMHVVPTISTGFNNVGWGGNRSPNMSVTDYNNAWLWVRDSILTSYANKTENWQKRLAVVSTWNEYGEGTYVMPSGLNGFGYLDAIRAAFCTPAPHTDVRPTENQLSRLGYLYPQNRSIIRKLGYFKDTGPGTPETVKAWNFVSNGIASTEWNYWGMTTPTVSGTTLTASPTGSDPIFLLKSDCSIDLTDVSYIKVTTNCPKGFQIFFSTVVAPTMDGAKVYNVTTTGSSVSDYYIKTDSNENWKGTLTRIRLDPVDLTNSFSVQSITLIKSLDKN